MGDSSPSFYWLNIRMKIKFRSFSRRLHRAWPHPAWPHRAWLRNFVRSGIEPLEQHDRGIVVSAGAAGVVGGGLEQLVERLLQVQIIACLECLGQSMCAKSQLRISGALRR